MILSPNNITFHDITRYKPKPLDNATSVAYNRFIGIEVEVSERVTRLIHAVENPNNKFAYCGNRDMAKTVIIISYDDDIETVAQAITMVSCYKCRVTVTRVFID